MAKKLSLFEAVAAHVGVELGPEYTEWEEDTSAIKELFLHLESLPNFKKLDSRFILAKLKKAMLEPYDRSRSVTVQECRMESLMQFQNYLHYMIRDLQTGLNSWSRGELEIFWNVTVPAVTSDRLSKPVLRRCGNLVSIIASLIEKKWE